VANNPLKYVDPNGLFDWYDPHGTGQSNPGYEYEGSSREIINPEYSYEQNDYTIDYKSLNSIPLTISFYDDSNADISVTFDGQTYVLGQDIDFGDSIPFDAEFDVPDGTRIELQNDQFRVTLGDVEGISLPEAMENFNRFVTSEEFKERLATQKTQGYVNLGLAAAEIGGSIYAGSHGNVGVASGLFLLGTQTAGFAIADIQAANNGILLDYPIVVKTVYRPVTYLEF
jgi:hypothetical protein